MQNSGFFLRGLCPLWLVPCQPRPACGLLKIIDDKDQELELIRKGYQSVIPERIQWRNWAAINDGRLIKLPLQVMHGTVMVNVENQDAKKQSFAQTPVSQAYMPVTLLFASFSSGSLQKLRIRNFSLHGVRSRVKIEALSLVDVVPSKS